MLGTVANWTPVPDLRAEHLALWRRLGAEIPQAESQVLIFNTAAHHTTLTWSLVASRGNDGRWRVEQIGEETSSLLRIEPRPFRSRWDLTDEQGRDLDRLLADPCLSAEPPSAYPLDPPGIGATFWTMDIATPSLQRSSQAVGIGLGLTGLVAQTIWKNENP